MNRFWLVRGSNKVAGLLQLICHIPLASILCFCKSIITDPQSIITDPQPIITDPQSIITDPQSIITDPQSGKVNDPFSSLDEACINTI